MAPSGQMYLQNGLNTNTDAMSKSTAIIDFHENKNPIALRREGLRMVSGQPAETVPAGQTHEQKRGAPIPSRKTRMSGATIQRRIRHTYFASEAPREMLRIVLVFGTFLVGILYKSS